MYVAFRLLMALSFAMWLGLCGLDIYLAQYKTSIFNGTAVSPYKIYKFTNQSISIDEKDENITRIWQPRKKYKHKKVAYLHYVTFLAGAIAVFVYNKKTLLVAYWKCKINKSMKFLEMPTHFIVTTENVSVAMLRYWRLLMERLRNYASTASQSPNGQDTTLSLLKRVKELVRDRKALIQTLMAAIEKNKNIRRQCQLEIIAKNRLLHYVQGTQSMVKENKSRYVDFQQLYLTTAKENSLLKDTIKKLKHEKSEAEKNLLELINVVYRSRNNDLKSYCTRFLVQTKNNLLNSDVSAEIRKFLHKSNSVIKTFFDSDFVIPRVTEIMEDDANFQSFGCRGPKLRGLPGDYVWTAKNKEGIIEKLYEYDCATDSDNGDTIQRIREYSVYHDKDCLLDQTSLAANIPACPSLSASATRLRLDIKSFSNQGLLTNILMRNIPLRRPCPNETPALPFTTCDL